jgi:hypothetical protein
MKQWKPIRRRGRGGRALRATAEAYQSLPRRLVVRAVAGIVTLIAGFGLASAWQATTDLETSLQLEKLKWQFLLAGVACLVIFGIIYPLVMMRLLKIEALTEKNQKQ